MIALFLLCAVLPIVSSAQTFTSLADFDWTDGDNPNGALVEGADGNFYGTTYYGGANGEGSVFQVTPEGALTAIYSFCSLPKCADGDQPFAGLVLGSNGILYGSTYGTIFSVTTGGQLTTLYTFCSLPHCADGVGVYDKLALGSDGNFYGTTFYGGTIETYECEGACGTVFKITPSGALTTLHSFRGKDGYWPVGGLTQGSDGNFYGTTSRGGAKGFGTIFKITSAGAFTLLHNFTGTDGSMAEGQLVQTADGTFYGTTAQGGPDNGGVVYKMTSAGKVTLLRSFNDSGSNGFSPEGLLLASDGNFYGTNGSGGSGVGNCPLADYCGTIFKLTPSGQLTTLYNFCPQSGCPEGGNPTYMVQGTDGNLYGPTYLGGSSNGTECGPTGSCGTIFKFSLGRLPSGKPASRQRLQIAP
jgi:uncharacterized repeat protein (TIGR03803 family)